MDKPLQGEIISGPGAQTPPTNSVFDHVKAGCRFASQMDTPMAGMLGGYFLISFLFAYFFAQPLSLKILMEGAMTPKIGVGLLSIGFMTMPLMIYTAQKMVLGAASGNYFSYFVRAPLWKLLFARFILVFFVLAPVVLIVSIMSMVLGGAAFLSNPFGGSFFVTFILLPGVTLFIISFVIRFFLINIHVPVVNQIELWPVFHLSRGHSLKILMTFLLALLPAVLMGILFSNIGAAHLWVDAHTPAAFAEVQNTHLILVTKDPLESALTQALFATALAYLNFIWMAALAHLYMDLQENG